MMAWKRLLPWLLSVVLLLVVTATALGSGTMQSSVYNKDRYWDSPVWRNQSADTYAQIKVKCRDESGTNDPDDWVTLRIWRHAGIFPPYSVGDRTFDACRNSQQTKEWSNNMGGAEDFHFQIRGFSYNGGYNGDRLIDLIPYTVTWDH